MEENFNSNQRWNNDKHWCNCKKCHVCEKDYIWNPATCICKNGIYTASIIDNSAIMCDEILETYDKETKNISTKFNENKATSNTQNFCILIASL